MVVRWWEGLLREPGERLLTAELSEENRGEHGEKLLTAKDAKKGAKDARKRDFTTETQRTRRGEVSRAGSGFAVEVPRQRNLEHKTS